MSTLPSGWTWAKLEDLAAAEPNAVTDGPFGSNLKTSDYVEGGPVRVIRLGNIGVGEFLDEDRSFISQDKFEPLRKHEAKEGDLVIAALAEPVGRCTEVPRTLGTALVKADCLRVRIANEVCARYVMHALNSPDGLKRAASSAHGMGRLRINLGDARSLLIPTAPVQEQRRIVKKIESLKARSRRAREALDEVPDLLEKLRQSILAAAFRGDLTKDWRAKNPDVEPAEKLLQRIRAERRKKWEQAELAKMQAKGKPPTDNRWKEKYPEHSSLKTTGLPELPASWCWGSLEEMSDGYRGIPYGIVQTGDDIPGGVPTVRCGDIKDFAIELARLKRVRAELAGEYQRTRLEGGEVLLAIRGTVGATAVASPEMRGMNISREVAMIPLLSAVEADFVMYCLAGPEAQGRLLRHVKGVAQAGINLSDVRSLPLPVPPLSEQQEIVQRVKTSMERCSTVSMRVAEMAEEIRRVDVSTLAKAFRGELVPQDPNDEPADVMLARLKAAAASPTSALASPPSSGKRRGRPRKP